ncbi:hypothetical protein JW916_07050 [Candidatus Sumerlaeota bacterium]|nr:hypothetical protein [Candidatus Sumerlaeota bacterium]
MRFRPIPACLLLAWVWIAPWLSPLSFANATDAATIETVYIAGYERRELKFDTYLLSWPDLKDLTPGVSSLTLPVFSAEVENGDIILGDGDDVAVNGLQVGPNGDLSRVPSGFDSTGLYAKVTAAPSIADDRVSLKIKLVCAGQVATASGDFGTSSTLTLEAELAGPFAREEISQARLKIWDKTEVLPFEPLPGIIDRLNIELQAVELTVTDLPDLRFGSIWPEGEMLSSADSHIGFTARNDGTLASDACQYQVRVDGALVGESDLPALAPNGGLFTQTGFNLGQLTAGSHTVTVLLDSADTVAESSETNNELGLAISVQADTAARPAWMLYE